MQIIQLFPVMMFAATTACLSSTMTPPPVTPASDGQRQSVESVRLGGFVELYAAEGAQLVTGGREILLSGATDRITAFGGLEVLVTGRFVGPDVFHIDSVARVQPALAVADSRP